MKFGEKLILLRKQRGMTQLDLAEKLDISRQSVSRWECGAADPSAENLVLLGKLFDVPVDVLVKDVPLEAPAPEPEPAPDEVPPPAAPEKARRWPLILVCAGVVCALLIGIAALIGIYSINQRLEPVDTAVPMEEINGKEVDVSARVHFDLEEPS